MIKIDEIQFWGVPSELVKLDTQYVGQMRYRTLYAHLKRLDLVAVLRPCFHTDALGVKEVPVAPRAVLREEQSAVPRTGRGESVDETADRKKRHHNHVCKGNPKVPKRILNKT